MFEVCVSVLNKFLQNKSLDSESINESIETVTILESSSTSSFLLPVLLLSFLEFQFDFYSYYSKIFTPLLAWWTNKTTYFDKVIITFESNLGGN